MVAPIKLSNFIGPPPRLIGKPMEDTVSIVQWLWDFYRDGILANKLLQTSNLNPSLPTSLQSLAALNASVGKIPIYTGAASFGLVSTSALGLAVLAAADAPTARAALGAGTVNSVAGALPIVSSGGANPQISINAFGASGGGHAAGAVPDPGVTPGASRFLCENATFAFPTQVGNAFVAGAPAATGYIRIQDSTGATYKILVSP